MSLRRPTHGLAQPALKPSLAPLADSPPATPITREALSGILDNTGGLMMTGDPGTGKSLCGRQINRCAAESADMAVFVLDPPGDLVQGCLRDVASMSSSVQQRVYHVVAGDPNAPLIPVNPLTLERHEGMGDYEYAARLACKVDHSAHLLLSTFGGESFDGAPLMYKYMSMIFGQLAQMRLSWADWEHFFPGSPLHQDFISVLPNPTVAAEFQELDQMKPFDRNQLTLSTKNKFDGLFSSPVVTAMLGVSDPQRCANVRQWIEDKALVYFDFSPRGLLGERHTALIANIWLSEIFFAILNTPIEQRRPVLIICDELPVFSAGSGPLITSLLPQTRKLLLRFAGLFQGTQRFPDGTENRLLHTMVSCCNKLIFRHTDPVDATFFGEMLSLPTLDITKEKFRHYEQELYHEPGDFLIYTTVDSSVSQAFSESESEGEGGDEHEDSNWNEAANIAETDQAGVTGSSTIADGTAHSENKSSTDSTGSGQLRNEDLIRESFSNANAQMHGTADGTTHNEAHQRGRQRSKSRQFGRNYGRGGASGRRYGWNRARQRQRSGSVSRAYRQHLVQRERWRQVLRFMEFIPLTDQILLTASGIARQGPGQVIVYIAGNIPYQLQLPMPSEPFAGAPKTAAKRMRRLLDEIYALPCYQLGSQLLSDRSRILRLAVEELRRLKSQYRKIEGGTIYLPELRRPEDEQNSDPRLGI